MIRRTQFTTRDLFWVFFCACFLDLSNSLSCSNAWDIRRGDVVTACVVFSEKTILPAPAYTVDNATGVVTPSPSRSTPSPTVPAILRGPDYYKINNRTFYAVFQPLMDKFAAYEGTIGNIFSRRIVC